MGNLLSRSDGNDVRPDLPANEEAGKKTRKRKLSAESGDGDGKKPRRTSDSSVSGDEGSSEDSDDRPRAVWYEAEDGLTIDEDDTRCFET